MTDADARRPPRRVWLIGGVVLVLVAVVGVVVAVVGQESSGDPEGSSERGPADTTAATAPDPDFVPVESPASSDVPEPAESPASSDAPEPAESSATSDAPESDEGPRSSVASSGFGSGKVTVGADAVPGLYVAVVPSGSTTCSWQRLGDPAVRVQEVIASGAASPGAQVIVELADTDGEFDSTGCGEWVAYLAPDEPVTVIGEGTWIVNEQILPGRYRSDGSGSDAAGCSWERQLGLSGQFFDIVESATVDGPATIQTVQIASSDFSFTSRGCGAWTLEE